MFCWKVVSSRRFPTSKPGDNVPNLVEGSGSTMITAERMGRRPFLMEIAPAYCDVIVTRWQHYTGKKATGWRGNGSGRAGGGKPHPPERR